MLVLTRVLETVGPTPITNLDVALMVTLTLRIVKQQEMVENLTAIHPHLTVQHSLLPNNIFEANDKYLLVQKRSANPR